MSMSINGAGATTRTVPQIPAETESTSCKHCGGRTIKKDNSAVGLMPRQKVTGNARNGVATKGMQDWAVKKEDGKSIVSGDQNKLSNAGNDDGIELEVSLGGVDESKSEIETSRKSVLLGKMKSLAGGIKKKGKSLLAKGAKKLGGRLKSKGKSIRKYGIAKKNKIVSMLPQKVANGVALNVLSPKSLKERIIGSVSTPKTLVQRTALNRLKEQTRQAFDNAETPLKSIKEAKSELKTLQKAKKAAEKSNAHGNNMDFSFHDVGISEKKIEIEQLKSVSTKGITKTIIAKEKAIYKQQLSTFKEKSNGLMEDIASIKGVTKKIKEEIKDLAKENNLKELRNEVSQLEDAVEELSEHVGDSDQETVVLEGETFNLKEMKQELEEKQTILEDVESKLSDLDSQIEDMNELRETREKESSDLAKSIRQEKRNFDRKANVVRQVKR